MPTRFARSRIRDRLQDRFTAGIVLHTGPRAFDLDDRIRAPCPSAPCGADEPRHGGAQRDCGDLQALDRSDSETFDQGSRMGMH